MITKTQKAMIMSRARLWHRNRASVTNAQLAIDIGLCDNRKNAVNFCHALGLYADGAKGHTNLNKMLEHIKGENDGQLGSDTRPDRTRA